MSMKDTNIIDLFFLRSEAAIGELQKKYGKICQKISYNILNDPFDAEECVNDTYLAVWNTIPPNRPEQLCAFVCRIVRNLSIKRYRSNTALKRNSSYDISLNELENVLSYDNATDSCTGEEELTGIINEFLAAQKKENRVIFIRRYWFFDSYEDIAKRTGLSVNVVSVRLVRIRKSLRNHLEKKGVII